MTDIGAILAENLKRARAVAGYSQRDVGYQVGADGVQVSRWERGASTPNVVALYKLARIYRVPMDVLFVQDHPMLTVIPNHPH